MRVLYAEDDENIANIVQTFLCEVGHMSVTLVTDGQAVLDCHQKQPLNDHFDLILLDDQMPKITGHEVCQILRQSGIQLPIVILSANSKDFQKFGATEAFKKPFEPMQLVQHLQNLVAS